MPRGPSRVAHFLSPAAEPHRAVREGVKSVVLTKDPCELVATDWLAEYILRRDVLHKELVRMRSNVYCLQRLLAFPVRIFVHRVDYPHILDLTTRALLDSTVLGIWRIVLDDGNAEGLTLSQFKNQVYQHLAGEEAKEQFGLFLREFDFAARIRRLEPQIQEIRNNYLAHLNLAKVMAPSAAELQLRTIALGPLRGYLDDIEQAFNALCFGVRCATLPLGYYPEIDREEVDNRSDVERLLDGVARHSWALSLPETDAYNWSYFRGTLTDDEVKEFNRWRKRFGKAEVD